MATEKNYNLLLTVKNINPVCPICSSRYDLSNIRILKEVKGGVLSFFSCNVCGSSFIASVSETPFGHIAKGMLVELDENEVLKFVRGESVSYDNVLDLHQEMEDSKMWLKKIMKDNNLRN